MQGHHDCQQGTCWQCCTKGLDSSSHACNCWPRQRVDFRSDRNYNAIRPFLCCVCSCSCRPLILAFAIALNLHVRERERQVEQTGAVRTGPTHTGWWRRSAHVAASVRASVRACVCVCVRGVGCRLTAFAAAIVSTSKMTNLATRTPSARALQTRPDGTGPNDTTVVTSDKSKYLQSSPLSIGPSHPPANARTSCSGLPTAAGWLQLMDGAERAAALAFSNTATSPAYRILLVLSTVCPLASLLSKS